MYKLLLSTNNVPPINANMEVCAWHTNVASSTLIDGCENRSHSHYINILGSFIFDAKGVMFKISQHSDG